MKVELESTEKEKIEYGDIFIPNDMGTPYLVVYDRYAEYYKCRVINLETDRVDNGFADIKALIENYDSVRIIKSKNILIKEV